MKLGELIIAYRKEHKLSQRQFAKKCGGVSNGYVSMLENDFNPATSKGITPSLDKLVCIASGMDMSVSELMEKVEDMPMDLSEVVARDVIYEDETDAEIVNMFIGPYAPRKGKLVKEESVTPSPEAIAFAQRFEKLDRHARDVLLAVMRIEEKRCEDQAMARNYLAGSDVPIIGEAIADGSVEARYAARKEVREITADPTPRLQENK